MVAALKQNDYKDEGLSVVVSYQKEGFLEKYVRPNVPPTNNFPAWISYVSTIKMPFCLHFSSFHQIHVATNIDHMVFLLGVEWMWNIFG